MAPLSNQSASFSLSATNSDRHYINLHDSCSADFLKALNEDQDDDGCYCQNGDFRGMMEHANLSLQSIFTTKADAKECSDLTMLRLCEHHHQSEADDDDDSIKSMLAQQKSDHFEYEVEGDNGGMLSWEPALPTHPLDEPSTDTQRRRRRQSLDSMRAYVGDDTHRSY